MSPAFLRQFASGALVLVAAQLHAGPADAAIVAAMKLPDAPNYTWTTQVNDDARAYTIEGQTERVGDYSLVRLPLVAAARRRLGRPGGESANEITAIYRGPDRLVIESDDGWKTLAEFNAPASSANPVRRGVRARGGPPGGWGGPRGRNAGADLPAYSNLQITLSRPHDEIAIIVANSSDLRAEGDSVSGRLSELGAKLLLVHPGQEQLTPLQATGTFRLWVRDGALVKYEVTLAGTLAVATSGQRREVAVHQTATTNLRAVGTTKFEVPAEAKTKLGP